MFRHFKVFYKKSCKKNLTTDLNIDYATPHSWLCFVVYTHSLFVF